MSRNGHKIELHDKDDTLTIATGDGQHVLVLDQKGNRVTLQTSGDIEVTSDAALSVSARSGMKLSSDGEVEIKANGVTIDAGGGSFSAKGVSSKVEGSGSVELSSSG